MSSNWIKASCLFGVLIFAMSLTLPTHVFAVNAQPDSLKYYTSGPISREVKNVLEATNSYVEKGTTSLETFSAGLSATCTDNSTGETTSCGPSSVLGSVLGGLTLGIIGGPSGGESIQKMGADGKMHSITIRYGTGAIGATTGMIAKIYENPTASSVEYIADVINDIKHPFGATPVYAQGLGYSSLSPVLALWKIMRNLSYFLFVTIFMVTGFLIMFRSKIGSQAAVTVQQALPKLVVSLILVSFSYAIAGLMIDVMYLSIYMIIGIFSSGGLFDNGIIPGVNVSFSDFAFRNSILSNMMALIGNSVGNVAGAVGNIATSALNIQQGTLAGWVVEGATSIIVTLVLAVIVLVSIFRVFIALLTSYVMLFFSVIFAPLQLLIGALPGQNTFTKWVQGIAENLVIFPAVITILLIAFYFSKPTTGKIDGVVTGFSAPQLTSNQEGGQGNYAALIALGAILALPEIAKISKSLMKGQLGVSTEDLQKNWAKGKMGQTVGLAGMGGMAGLAVGTGIGAAAGAVQASKARPGERWKAFSRSVGTGAVIGGVAGLSSPVSVPLGIKTVKNAIGGAASAYGQAAVGGYLEEEARRRELIKQQKNAQQGPVTTPVP